MTITTVSCLGFVSLIRYTDLNGDDFELSFKTKNSWSLSGQDSFLMVAESEKVISIVPWKAQKTPIPKGANKQKGLYCDWSGYEQSEAYKINLPRSYPILIGHITRIEYTSDKFDRRGDKAGKFNLYRHDFKRKQKLYSNRAETIYTITSKQTLVNYRGIIG
jgi:hypothetical protein